MCYVCMYIGTIRYLNKYIGKLGTDHQRFGPQELRDTLRGIKDAHDIISLIRWEAERIDEETKTTCPKRPHPHRNS